MLYIAPYKLGSQSAKLIADELDIYRIKGTKIMPRNTVIINWGNDSLAPRARGRLSILNSSNAISIAKNKTKTLVALQQAGISVPEFTTNADEARRWLLAGSVVYARRTVTGQGGEGIEVIMSGNTVPMCPLYTKGIIKAHEYRVHVFRGKAITFSKKKRRLDQDTNDFIKNHDNGWVFCQEEVDLPVDVHNQAIKAVAAVGLDFAAVDILHKNNKAYVLELNTAPGVEGRTLGAYVKTFKEFYETHNQR